MNADFKRCTANSPETDANITANKNCQVPIDFAHSALAGHDHRIMPTKIQLRCINLMGKTVKVVNNLLSNVTQTDATTYRDPRDGVNGWTALEVLCHLVDFDDLVNDRITLMIANHNPHFAVWDHDTLVTKRQYNHQELRHTVSSLLDSRKALQSRFASMTDELWLRTAVHPEYGDYTMTDLALQVGWHDATHIEQLTRILNSRGGEDAGHAPR